MLNPRFSFKKLIGKAKTSSQGDHDLRVDKHDVTCAENAASGATNAALDNAARSDAVVLKRYEEKDSVHTMHLEEQDAAELKHSELQCEVSSRQSQAYRECASSGSSLGIRGSSSIDTACISADAGHGRHKVLNDVVANSIATSMGNKAAAEPESKPQVDSSGRVVIEHQNICEDRALSNLSFALIRNCSFGVAVDAAKDHGSQDIESLEAEDTDSESAVGSVDNPDEVAANAHASSAFKHVEAEGTDAESAYDSDGRSADELLDEPGEESAMKSVEVLVGESGDASTEELTHESAHWSADKPDDESSKKSKDVPAYELVENSTNEESQDWAAAVSTHKSFEETAENDTSAVGRKEALESLESTEILAESKESLKESAAQVAGQYGLVAGAESEASAVQAAGSAYVLDGVRGDEPCRESGLGNGTAYGREGVADCPISSTEIVGAAHCTHGKDAEVYDAQDGEQHGAKSMNAIEAAESVIESDESFCAGRLVQGDNRADRVLYDCIRTSETHCGCTERKKCGAVEANESTGALYKNGVVRAAESALRDCSEVEIRECCFAMPYVLWHNRNFTLQHCVFSQKAKDPLWNSYRGSISNSTINSPKALRQSLDVSIDACTVDGVEFGWKSSALTITKSKIHSDYCLLDARNVEVKYTAISGSPVLQYIEDGYISDSTISSDDALWHARNITLHNCSITGSRLGWYSDGLTLINCKISSLQALCYCKRLKLVNCTMEQSTECFENSDVDADINGHISSIRNPLSGRIIADSIGSKMTSVNSIYGACSIIERNAAQSQD